MANIELPAYAAGNDDLDEFEYEDEEFASLISTKTRGEASDDNPVKKSPTEKSNFCDPSLYVAFLLLGVGVMLLRHIQDDPDPGNVFEENFSPVLNKGSTEFSCPKSIQKSTNDNTTTDYFKDYEADAIDHQNKTLDDYRLMTMDGWHISYHEVKEMLRPWKEEVFVPNIRSGDSIYESACGSGLNLLLTAEILSEHGIRNVTVSGNDYVEVSVSIANRIWEDDDATRFANKGRFCRGDSSNLDFLPDESFDLVYTGYIDPIVDPLNILSSNATVDDKWSQTVGYCNAEDAKSQKFAQNGQQAQNAWYASWVDHLVRIAKPGKVIAVENGAESLCTNQLDWGGVDKGWWQQAIESYKWDVEPESLLIREEETIPGGHWKDKRYHVMMRKSG